MRDKEEPSEHHVQPHLDSNSRQLPLTSLTSLQPNVKTLINVLKAKAILIGSHQMVFQGFFQNTNEGQIVSCFSNEIGHRLWFQGPFIHLGGEWMANYITIVFHRILEFLNI